MAPLSKRCCCSVRGRVVEIVASVVIVEFTHRETCSLGLGAGGTRGAGIIISGLAAGGAGGPTSPPTGGAESIAVRPLTRAIIWMSGSEDCALTFDLNLLGAHAKSRALTYRACHKQANDK